MNIRKDVADFLVDLGDHQWKLLCFILLLVSIVFIIALLLSGRKKKGQGIRPVKPRIDQQR